MKAAGIRPLLCIAFVLMAGWTLRAEEETVAYDAHTLWLGPDEITVACDAHTLWLGPNEIAVASNVRAFWLGPDEITVACDAHTLWLGPDEITVASDVRVFCLGVSFTAWAAEQGLSGADAAWDAKPSVWGGTWQNGFIYTYGEGLADGTLTLMRIGFDAEGKPVITTTPVIEGHNALVPAVIGSQKPGDWAAPVVLENVGDDWRIPAGKSANFFRVRLSE